MTPTLRATLPDRIAIRRALVGALGVLLAGAGLLVAAMDEPPPLRERGTAVELEASGDPELELVQLREADPSNEADPSRVAPRSGRDWWELGYEHHRAGRYEEAIRAFEKAHAIGYRPEASLYNVACGYARLGEPHRAMDTLERALDAGFEVGGHLGEDPDLASLRDDPRFQELAESASERGLAAGRQQALERFASLEEESGDGSAWYDAGMELHYAGEFRRAIDAWQRAIELGEKPDAATYNIACARAMLGDRPEALSALDRSLELGFGDAEHLLRDDDLASLRGDARFAALVETARTLELPNDGWEDGEPVTTRDEWAAAAERYRGHVEEHPRSGRGWFSLGYAELRLGRPAVAATHFERAFELDFRPATSAYDVACARAQQGDLDGAFAWLERAVELGFDRHWHLEHDRDLDPLRADPRFEPLVDRLRDEHERKHEVHRP